MIKKVRSGYRVESRRKRNLRTYRTGAEAERRLRQVEMFKHLRQK
jgi:hypothetical protein